MTRATTHRIVFAPFGQHTRYLFLGYLRNVVTVLSILLAIGLTIDLWPQFPQVAAHGSDAVSSTWAVIFFAILRTPGIIAPLIPFATFIGVLWTEVAHTQSGERMLVWNSGRSPLQCLTPALLLGLLLGGVSFTFDGVFGPASMAIQMKERLGRDGERLDRSKLTDASWIAVPEGLVRAQIEFGPPVVLHDLVWFRRDEVGRILEVDTAPIARLMPGTNIWRLDDGQYWAADKIGAPQLAAGSSSRQMMTPFVQRSIVLAIDPLWLTYYNLVPQYIPLPALAKLARSQAVPDAHGQYETRLYTVIAEGFLPAAMALLAASLAMLLLAYRTSAPALIGVVFAGYGAHFAIKAGLILGQNGFAPPVLAGLLVPVLIFAATGVVLFICESQRRNRRPI